MPNSILEAIQLGIWDYEPPTNQGDRFSSTEAMPGTREKLDILAARLQEGLPLWHPSDRTEYDMQERIDHRQARRAGRSVNEMLAEA